MVRLLAVLFSLACIAVAAWYATPRPGPRGFSGLEFAGMTRSAAARAPLMTTRGALVYDVIEDSPAAAAGIVPGEVVSAIDGAPVSSARQASDIVRGHKAGDRVVFTLFDETEGELHPRRVAVTFAASPPNSRKHSVKPPRVLAKEYFFPPGMAANAAWSRRIQRGPTIRPTPLMGLGVGGCSGLAPDQWEVRGHAGDDSLFHIAAKAGFQHALYAGAALDGRDPQSFIRDLLRRNFSAAAAFAPPQKAPFGFTLLDFGMKRGATGFALYRVGAGRIAVWIAAVPAADASWAEPLVGAVALTLRCPSPAAAMPRDPAMVPTTVSASCLAGRCEEGDFAGAYLSVLQLGYVHDRAGRTYLVHPRRDFWQNGAEGPGFYRQTGGENEKLEPGRTN